MGAGHSAAWTFDEMGRVLSEQKTIGTLPPKTVAYDYNYDGSLYKLTYPSGRNVVYHPTGAGHVDWAAYRNLDPGTNIDFVTGAHYKAHGAPWDYTLGTVIKARFSYNSRLQPYQITFTNGPALTDSDLQQTTCRQTVGNILHFAYTFVSPNNGNLASIANCRSTGRSLSFQYDALNRLSTGATQASTGAHCWGFQYGYDAWANLNSAASTQCDGNIPTEFKFSFTSNTKNQILGYCYDAAGNLTYPGACGPTAYAYDAENRLVAVADATYTYDGDGKRVQKALTAGGGKLYWMGDGADALAESDLAGNLTAEFIFFNGRRIARVDGNGSEPSPTVHYYFSDHLGSSNVVTSAAGAIEEESDFYPYGGEVTVANSLPDQDYKFTGKERDTETGLDYFIARHYWYAKGRFLQPDEFPGGPVDAFSSNDPLPPGPLPYADITNPQSLNKYTYTVNNPVRYTDPDGHCGFFCGAIVGGVVGAAVELYVQSQTRPGEPIDWKQVGKTAAVGALIGGGLGVGVDLAFRSGSGQGDGNSPQGDSGIRQEQSGESESSELGSGEPPQLKAGKDAHKAEPIRPGEKAEVPTPSGTGRMDRYDADKSHIREIKPGNSRGHASGEKQLQRYKSEMDKATGKQHTTELTTYETKKKN